MAGAGYKLFNTGDVLTAAQVNTYLQEQTVMVFADAAARTTALSGVLSEGMITYLKDTNAVEKYTGSAWVNIDTGSTSPLTTKGDLYTYSTTDTRLAVGNNGETLVADSSATTGLRWQPQSFVAAKNVLINGNYDIWQRGTTFTGIASGSYCADRWNAYLNYTGGTTNITQDTSVPNGNSKFSIKVAHATANTSAVSEYSLRQFIEGSNILPFIGQTVTLSFWVRSTKTGNHGYRLYPVNITGAADTQGTFSISSANTWEKKTITTSSFLGSATAYTGTDNATAVWVMLGFNTNGSGQSSISNGDSFQLSQVQIEIGNVATTFSRAGGTLAGELAACQRYYWRTGGSNVYETFGVGSAFNTTDVVANVAFPVEMRVAPTTLDYANLAVYDGTTITGTPSSVVIYLAGKLKSNITFTKTGFTQYRPYQLIANNTGSAYIGFGAEL